MTTRQFEKFKIEDMEFSIRFDSENSMFFCHMFDKLFQNESVKLLKETLYTEYNQMKKTTWEPVIEIETMDSSFSDSYLFDVEIRFLGTVILPGGEEKKIIAHSTRIEFKGDKKDISNYEPCRPYTNYNLDRGRTKYIPYSLKKFESLKYIESQIEGLRTKIRELLSSDDCEGFLETVSNNTLPQLEYKPNEERGKDE